MKSEYEVDEEIMIRALELAVGYHDGQVDKAGMPYIDHCIRVGIRAGLKAETKEEFRILTAIGFLHDVLEDTELTMEELREVIKSEIVANSVQVLTRIEGQIYFDYIDQVSEERFATLVKLADIEDHLEHPNGYVMPESLKHRYKTARKQLMESDEYLKHIHGYYH